MAAQRAYLAGLQRVLPRDHLSFAAPADGVQALDAVWEPLDLLEPAGKELLVAVSTGGPGDAYSHESSYGYTLTELLRPLQATANMVQMTYREPFTTTGTLTITDEALAQRAEDYAATLQSTDLPVLDLRG